MQATLNSIKAAITVHDKTMEGQSVEHIIWIATEFCEQHNISVTRADLESNVDALFEMFEFTLDEYVDEMLDGDWDEYNDTQAFFNSLN